MTRKDEVMIKEMKTDNHLTIIHNFLPASEVAD